MKELRSFASCEKTWKQGAAVLASSARSLKAPKTCSLYPQRMSDCFPLNCAQGDGCHDGVYVVSRCLGCYSTRQKTQEQHPLK